MADLVLADHLAQERADAIRLLLRTPLLDASDSPDAFRLVARQQSWLIDWFETTCGWRLTVDAASGFVRLAKRSSSVDPTRPLRRSRGANAPFDRRRYQLLCLVAAELVRHPVTTVGLLAGAVTADAALDSSKRGERAAFVDALRALIDWGVLRSTAGDVDAFVDDGSANAILTADTARMHRLLASNIAPSALADDLGVDDAIQALLREARYGDAAVDYEATTDEQRLRWVRHRLARRLLDDPAVHLDDLSAPERDYLASISGRRWLRDRVSEAGLELDERREGLVAVDPDAIATDERFPAPHGNVHQCALLLVDELVPTEPATGERSLATLDPSQVLDHVRRLLDAHPGWAKAYREGAGPQQLAAEAIELLAAFDLVGHAPDGSVRARPALARYRAAEPVIVAAAASQASLFEDVP